MKNSIIRIFLFLFFISNSFFLESQPKWKGKIVYEKGVKVVKNPSEPLYGDWKFELEKDLVIGEKEEESSLFLRPLNIKIDGEGNIYILDPKAYKIHKFSKDGKYLLSMGRKGEGPGEFGNAFYFCVDIKGNVYLFDSSGMRLVLFDANGKFVKQIKIGKFLWDFKVDEKGRIFGFTNEIEGSNFNTILIEVMQNGSISKPLAKNKEGSSIFSIGERTYTFSHPYLFDFYFTLSGKNIIYGYSSDYYLSVFERSGKLIYKFEKEERKIPVSSNERDEILSRFKNVSPEIKKHIDFAPYRPFFDSIFTDDAGRIYVRRMKSVLDESKNTDFDIFSEDGKYLYRTILPLTQI